MDEKLKAAGEAYAEGYTCSQAVFLAFSDELGFDKEVACRMMEGFGGGFGGMQEVCGALCAATAVISCYYSKGKPDHGEDRKRVYEKVRQAGERLRREYGGVTCKEILKGESPKAFKCAMKIKDSVLIINEIIEEGNKDKSL